MNQGSVTGFASNAFTIGWRRLTFEINRPPGPSAPRICAGKPDLSEWRQVQGRVLSLAIRRHS
jgi:hypothetical protein